MTAKQTFRGRLRVLARKLNRRYHRKFGRWSYNENGENIFERDWDNLFILDACRYDLLKERFDEEYLSFSSSVNETVDDNIVQNRLHKLGYVE